MKTAASWTMAAMLAFSCAQAGYAQTPAPKAPTVAAPTTAASDEAKKAKAKECSAQADAKGLHGKARKEFRSKCKAK